SGPQAAPPAVEWMEASAIAAGVVLVMFVTSSGERRSLRSSLWGETAEGWGLRFPQGTPASTFFSPSFAAHWPLTPRYTGHEWPRGLQLGEVLHRPAADRGERLGERVAERRECVLDVRRDDVDDGTGHEPVGLHAAQRLGEHLLGDALDRAAQLAVPPRALH